jgi:MFS family permease
VRQEIRLAQAEMREKGKHLGVGAGLVGGGGLVALYGIGVLLAAVVMLLATALEPWVAALIVAVVLLIVAAILALVGRKQVEQATPPLPEEAAASVQEDVRHIKEKAAR